MAQAAQLRLGYYSQHQMDLLRPDTTVLGEIRRLADPHTNEEELMSVLGLFMLGENYFDRQISLLSGGEKCRLVLASLFLKRCNCLILDEPTNHLDLESREALLKALNQYTGTLLMIAHDRWLLSETGCETWELNSNGLTVYQDYASYDLQRQAQLKAKGQNLKEEASKIEEDKTKALSREDQKRLKREQAEQRNALHRKLKPLQEQYNKYEQELNEVLNLQAQVEEELANPEIYADHTKSTQLLNQFEDCKLKSESLLESMSKLEEEIDNLKN